MTPFGPISPNNIFASQQPDTSKVRLYFGESATFLNNLLDEVEPDGSGRAIFSNPNFDHELLRFCYFDYGSEGEREHHTDYRPDYDEGDFEGITELIFDINTKEITGTLEDS